jgi:uncharacterized repeat protein (TIGR01451 family)
MLTFHRSRRLVFALFIGFGAAAALLPAVVVAQTQPVTVTITHIEQIGDDFDPISLGDFYAHVTINGTTLSTFDQRFSFDGGFIVPSGDLIPDPAWVLTRDVDSALGTVAVRIEIFDDDLATGAEEADLKPGPGEDLNLVVDLATGRWSGDVSWPQACSSGGSSLSSDFLEVCFDISVLSASGDADGDGLLDGWEQHGFNDEEDTVIDVDLPALGANPLRKDAFVEVDCLVASDHSHCPRLDAITDAVQSFANAPVSNPDGTTGVQLHLDVGPIFGAGLVTPVLGTGGVTGTFGDLGGGGSPIPEAGNEIIEGFGGEDKGATDFSDLKVFDSLRGYIFRYAIFGHQTNVRRDTNDCTSGQTRNVPGRDFFVTLGGLQPDGDPCHVVDPNGFSVGSRAEQAGTFMHELGHNLGLSHGGDDDINKKPNYLSVMSYAFQDCNVPLSPNGVLPGGCDYSRILLPTLEEPSLDECVGIDAGQLGFGQMDWDGDTVIEGVSNCTIFGVNSVADLNNDGICIEPGDDEERDTTPAGDDATDRARVTDGPNRVCNTTANVMPPTNTTAPRDDEQATAVGSTPSQPDSLSGFEDWNSLRYSLLDVARAGGSLGAPNQDEPDPETRAEARAYLGALLAPGVQVGIAGPATAQPGDVLTYTVEIRNQGAGPALQAVLTQTLPDGGTQVSDIGAVIAGGVAAGSSTFTVPADACPGDFTAASASVVFKDFVGSQFSAAHSTPLEILDVAAPALSVSATPAILWEPNHKFQNITVTVAVQDNCDANPAITLVSVTSNEPATGFLGSGDKGPDIQGAAVGTDDRSFSVRAERGTGNGSTGRVYTIIYRATDQFGNASEATATVTVPTDVSGLP